MKLFRKPSSTLNTKNTIWKLDEVTLLFISILLVALWLIGTVLMTKTG
ncbi:hypothetical protein ACEZ3G_05395 [Maribacter algicola]|uniref:Uncharacterized protein n=1 Tax=Meishania litoralis TaxID=3434685 RepID=A0ACC7LHA1_9FLAO